ncbi:hypothetical protein MRB53_015963 [Persea americana]|uniref:Uncharacterized protein n=1 Tax=Persea americana TaxID=3435 RepID=A0ACC2M1U2_PERAE|nr:hypothetical protein MRB53_015963 [Persea americana]
MASSSATSSSFSAALTSSPSPTPNFVISNIANLIPIKLDNSNFLLWKSLFRPILQSHCLEPFIDGLALIPPRDLTDSANKTTPNPAFFEWCEKDPTLLSWINATLSNSALPYIVGMETTKAAWDSLECRYGSFSRSHIIELKKRLQHIKRESSSMQDYLHQIQVLADQLATYGSPVGDEDLILHTLAGLPSLYHPFQTAIRTKSRHDPVSLKELHTLLICEELSLTEDTTNDSSTAFNARRTVPQRSSPPGNFTASHNQQHRHSSGSFNCSSRNSIS